MGPRRLIALLIASAIASAAIATQAVQAFPQNGGTETATLDMPADGIGIAHTDQLPAAVTQADVTVTPLTDEQFFSKLAVALTNSVFVDFADRVEVCVTVTKEVVKNPNFFPNYTIPQDKTLQALFLGACLQTALEVSQAQQTGARSASTGCVMTRLVMSLHYTRTSSGYTAQVTPTTVRPPQRRSAVRVSCQTTATGLRIKIRPKKRGQKLRSTVGPMLGLGVVNPTAGSPRLRISFTAR